MSKAICNTPDCGKTQHARGLCKTCYGRLLRADGYQPLLPLDVHTLTDVDAEAASAVCVICGPTRIKVRKSRGRHECWTVTKRHMSGSKPKPGDRRLRRYKITVEQYAAMIEAQGGRCAICGRSDELKVDHDHSCCAGDATCGECVRGLLCDWCNRGLGIFRDNPEALSRAAAYLASYRSAIGLRQ